MQTYERFIVAMHATGMCYRMTFFLSTYLRREHSITAPVVVGYVHDGTGDVMTSHAWIEFDGKKTDISLTMTDEPSVQLQGQLIVLDQVLKAGHAYTYDRAQDEAFRIPSAPPMTAGGDLIERRKLLHLKPSTVTSATNECVDFVGDFSGAGQSLRLRQFTLDRLSSGPVGACRAAMGW